MTEPGRIELHRLHLGTCRPSVVDQAVLCGDNEEIRLGAGSNVQDGPVGDADPGFPLRIGQRVGVGPRVVLHGRTIDDVPAGMGAIVMNGAHVGTGSIIAAGALVTRGTEIPPGSLVAGDPGRIRRAVTDDEHAATPPNGEDHRRHARLHRGAFAG